MNTVQLSSTDRIIRRGAEIAVLSLVSFGLPVAIAVACIQPSLNGSMDYDRNALHLFGYQIGFSILDFVKTIPAASFIGLVAWVAPMLILTNALRHHLQAPLSIVLAGVALALADLYVVSGYSRNFSDSYNYMIGFCVVLGAWIAANYLSSHPIVISEI